MTLFTGKLSVVGDPTIAGAADIELRLGAGSHSRNQKAVATALDTAANSGNYGAQRRHAA